MSDEVPEAFEYLVPLFDKFGGLWMDQEIKSCAGSLSSDELGSLRGAYGAIGDNHQLEQLTEWIDRSDRSLATAREKHLHRGAFGLLRAFEEPGERSLLPFSDGLLRY